jgi:hypothetical protein
MFSRTIRATEADMAVTLPDEGDLISDEVVIPVEALRAWSMGKLPLAEAFRNSGVIAQENEPDPGLRVRVGEVKVDGVWIPL